MTNYVIDTFFDNIRDSLVKLILHELHLNTVEKIYALKLIGWLLLKIGISMKYITVLLILL